MSALEAPLEVRGVSIHFGGVQALLDVSLGIDRHAITGLIGPNGAGKTTLLNVMSGLLAPNAGRVLIDGRDVTAAATYRRARLGLGRTFQRFELFSSLTVRDNVLVAAELRREWDRHCPPVEQITDETLELVGASEFAQDRADTLPTGRARLVELARALASGARTLLLDEPSSGLDDHESGDFGRLLSALAAGGLAILLVEHDVHLVMSVCQRIWVLDFGCILAEGTPLEISENAAVQAAYLGADATVAAQAALAGSATA